MAQSEKMLRKGLALVVKHHGQEYTWGDVRFNAVASTPGLRFGPGPIGLSLGSEYDVSIRADKSQFRALPEHGDQIQAPDGKWLTVGGVQEMPGGHTVLIRCRINQR